MLTAAVMTVGLSSVGVAPATAAHGTVDRAASGVTANGLVALGPTPECQETIAFGMCEKEVAAVAVPGVLTTGVLKVRTEGTHQPLKADSTASVAEIVALPGAGPADPAALTANLVTSSCTAAEDGVVGDTVIADIDILGVEPTETELTDPDPNFVVVDNPLLFIVLNEQLNGAGEPFAAGDDQIVVNAIRIVALPGTELEQEIIISQSQCSIHAADAPPPAGNGYLEICKKADNSAGRVTGKFRFRFAGRGVTVPVGQCSGPIRVPAGPLLVREVKKDGVRMSGCATRPTHRLMRCSPAQREAVVRIVEGGVRNETVLTVTNRRIVLGDNTGAIKVCKIAGNGVQVGTRFRFAVGSKDRTVPAGPASQGGYCKVVRGFARGSTVKVTERPRAGTHVSQLTVRPVDRRVSINKGNRTATVRVGKGFTVVSFTNARN